jgi:hypothetical protein
MRDNNPTLNALGGRNLLKLMLDVDKVTILGEGSLIILVPEVGTIHLVGYKSAYSGLFYYTGYILDAPDVPSASSSSPRTVMELLTNKKLTF